MSCFCICSFGLSPDNFSRKLPSFSNELPLIRRFLGKNVLVELEDFRVHGKLIGYEFGRKEKPHKPFILIVESSFGKIIIRGNWFSIGEARF
jgi:hypothetical protein